MAKLSTTEIEGYRREGAACSLPRAAGTEIPSPSIVSLLLNSSSMVVYVLIILLVEILNNYLHINRYAPILHLESRLMAKLEALERLPMSVFATVTIMMRSLWIYATSGIELASRSVRLQLTDKIEATRLTTL